jgi:hypothetical protein
MATRTNLVDEIPKSDVGAVGLPRSRTVAAHQDVAEVRVASARSWQSRADSRSVPGKKYLSRPPFVSRKPLLCWRSARQCTTAHLRVTLSHIPPSNARAGLDGVLPAFACFEGARPPRDHRCAWSPMSVRRSLARREVGGAAHAVGTRLAGRHEPPSHSSRDESTPIDR